MEEYRSPNHAAVRYPIAHPCDSTTLAPHVSDARRGGCPPLCHGAKDRFLNFKAGRSSAITEMTTDSP